MSGCSAEYFVGRWWHACSVPEELLRGGFVTEVVRVGDTVRRRPGRNAGFVHRLLEWLERASWDGAPRFRGVDEEGREILSFLPGHVPWQPAEQMRARSDDSLAVAAQLVRQFHDLTAGTCLAGGCEVVCHNDLSPKNTVYRDRAGVLRPLAFIDWDIAAPGQRIHDIAHVCWQYAGLRPADQGHRAGLLAGPDHLRRLRTGRPRRRGRHDLVVAGPLLARHPGRRRRGRSSHDAAARLRRSTGSSSAARLGHPPPHRTPGRSPVGNQPNR